MKKRLIKIANITKCFDGAFALNNVSMNIESGKIHALIGSNAAGKSLLMRILAGLETPTSGKILIDDTEYNFSTPKDAQDQGIFFISQDVPMAQDLKVSENIVLGNMPSKKFFNLIDWKQANQICNTINEDYHLELKINQQVFYQNNVQKQNILVAKAIANHAQTIIFDEPYINIGANQFSAFSQLVKQLAGNDIAVVIITHEIDFVQTVADDFTLLEEGALQMSNVPCENLSHDLLSNSFKPLQADPYPKIIQPHGRVLLEVKNISTDRILNNISFNVRKGEVIGLAGLAGSGRTAISRALFGLDKIISGQIVLNGTPLKLRSPKDAIRNKIGYVGEDSRLSSLLLDFDIPDNIALPSLDQICRLGFLNENKIYKLALKYIKLFNIHGTGINTDVSTLSTGNQQKVLLSRWLSYNTNILILDEITKCIDSSAKIEIYNFMNKYISDGKSIIFISSQINELIGMCDRIITLNNGQISNEFHRSEFNENTILKYTTCHH